MVKYLTPVLIFAFSPYVFAFKILRLFLVFVFPGLDWKIFTSSCLPKKFREEVTFGGNTYKVSGIPDGKIKAAWGFDCLPSLFGPTIHTFLYQAWSTIEYSTIQSRMRTYISLSSFNLGTKHMFCHPLPLCVPSWTIILLSTLYLNKKENCQLTSQIRQSLPYHSQVAKRFWACPWVVIFLCVTSSLIWPAHNYVVKIDSTTGLR